MTDEAATAHWFPAKIHQGTGGQPKIAGGKQRDFESVKNAVRFTMEELPPGHRLIIRLSSKKE